MGAVAGYEMTKDVWDNKHERRACAEGKIERYRYQ